MEANYRSGFLPSDGGWNDQDPDDVSMIRLASSERGKRIRTNEKMKKSKSSRKQRR